MKVSQTLLRLQDTTAEIRVRGAFLLLARLRLPRLEVRARGDPRRVPRGRDAEARRPRRGHDARVLPRQARGRRLRRLRALLLRLDRDQAGRRQPLQQRLDARARAALPRRAADRARAPGADLPAVRRARLAARRRRAAAGDVALDPGRRRADRRRPRPHPARELRRARRRRPALGDRLPARRADAAARPAGAAAVALRRNGSARPRDRSGMRALAIALLPRGPRRRSHRTPAATPTRTRSQSASRPTARCSSTAAASPSTPSPTTARAAAPAAARAPGPGRRTSCSGAVRAGAGAKRSLLGTTRRADGSRQVTYAGRPLYYYVGDRKAGQILCQNVSEFGGLWLVVRGERRARPIAPQPRPRRMIRSATSPVQPVWWEAPRPAPVSPWKYSWNGIRSCQAGSRWKQLVAAEDRPRPVLALEEDAGQPAGELVGDLGERELRARAGRELDREGRRRGSGGRRAAPRSAGS